MKQYNWGIMGAGIVAHKFADALSRNERCLLRGVASKTPSKASDFATQHGAEHSYSYEEIVSDPEIDIIYVATTHNFHFENAKLALEHGKNVLIEKAFTVNAGQASELADIAEANDCFLMEAIWVRFLPSYQRLKGLLSQGAIGEIKQYQLSFGGVAPAKYRDRLNLPELAGGVTLDMGIYPLTFVCFMQGEFPSEVHSTAMMNEHGVDQTANYLLKFPSGAQANICTSFNLRMLKDAYIYGTEGYVHYPSFQQGPAFSLHKYLEGQDVESETFELDNDDNGFIYQVQEVVECLDREEKESKTITVSETLQIMQIMDTFRSHWGLTYPGE